MANSKLGSSDVRQLLATYESKQRQLQFELDRIKATVRNLKSVLPELEKSEAEQAAHVAAAVAEIGEVSVPKVADRKAAPRKAAKTKTAPKKKAAPRKSKATDKKDRSSGYRLSEYDEYVFDALRANGRAMINSELVTSIVADRAEKGQAVTEDEVQTMVVRSLQKLANRRDDIRKVPYEGRGMAYALPEWLNGQGVIKKKHAHKRK